MVVRIRLARFGRTRQPIYNIVVSQARSARGSKPMEVLGTYDPLPRVPLANDSTPDTMTNADGEEVPFVPKKIKDVKLDISRTKYWLGVGAQPSEPVEKLLCMIGLMEPRPSRTRTPTGAQDREIKIVGKECTTFDWNHSTQRTGDSLPAASWVAKEEELGADVLRSS